ncbi:MAG: Hpt domain-containing protein [Treponema sp.]|jgi:chemotaxis protein histidine kinase CheA|nr:Hpt domain-containing protein [Treponema sp.]
MAIDREKYTGKFIDESLVFDIKDCISVEDDLAALLRALHTLKGSSRMLEFKNIEELSHCLENVFISVKEQRIGLSDNGIKLILASLERLKQRLGAVQRNKNDNLDIEIFTKNLNAMAANEEYFIPQTDSRTAELDIKSYIPQDENPEQKLKKEPVLQTRRVDNAKSESIRLSLDKIDDIIKSIASLQTLEITSKTISLDSAALNNAIKEFSRALKTDSVRGSNLAADFRKIERLGGKINNPALKGRGMLFL